MNQGSSVSVNAKYLAMVVEMMKIGNVSIKMIGEYVKTSDESQEFKNSIAKQFEEMYLECRRRVEKEEFEGTDNEVRELYEEAKHFKMIADEAKSLLKKARIARDIKKGKQPAPPTTPAPVVDEEKAPIPEKDEGVWKKVVSKKIVKKDEMKTVLNDEPVVKKIMKKDIFVKMTTDNHEWGCDIHEDGGSCDCRVSQNDLQKEFPTLQETVPKATVTVTNEKMVPATVAKKVSNVGKLAAMFEKKTVNTEEAGEAKMEMKPKTKTFAKKSTHVVDPDRVNIFTTMQYSNYIKQGGRPCKNGFACTRGKCDFLHIDDKAMCPTTYAGEVCKNVNVRDESLRCNKIHIKRCRDNESCTRKNCTFLHGHEMVDKEAARRFKHTMEEYSEFVY